MKKELCNICKKEYEVEDYISEPACPDCFNGCSEPAHHQGRACDKTSFLEITCTYPYLEPTIRFSEKAFDDWSGGKMERDRILHELCHMITDPLYIKAIERYVGKNEIEDERERLTDTLTVIIRNLVG